MVREVRVQAGRQMSPVGHHEGAASSSRCTLCVRRGRHPTKHQSGSCTRGRCTATALRTWEVRPSAARYAHVLQLSRHLSAKSWSPSRRSMASFPSTPGSPEFLIPDCRHSRQFVGALGSRSKDPILQSDSPTGLPKLWTHRCNVSKESTFSPGSSAAHVRSQGSWTECGSGDIVRCCPQRCVRDCTACSDVGCIFWSCADFGPAAAVQRKTGNERDLGRSTSVARSQGKPCVPEVAASAPSGLLG